MCGREFWLISMIDYSTGEVSQISLEAVARWPLIYQVRQLYLTFFRKILNIFT